MQIKFTDNIQRPESEAKDFHISVIIRVFAQGNKKFAGATAKGKFLKGVKRIEEKDAETSFIVKLSQETDLEWPMAEGIFDLDFHGEAWLDDRDDDPSKHCVRIKCDPDSVRLVRTRDLFKKDAK